MTYENKEREPIYKLTVACSYEYSSPPPIVLRYDDITAMISNNTETKLYLVREPSKGEMTVTEARVFEELKKHDSNFINITTNDAIFSNDKKLLKNFLDKHVKKVRWEYKDKLRKFEDMVIAEGNERYYRERVTEIKKCIANIEKYYKKMCLKLKEL